MCDSCRPTLGRLAFHREGVCPLLRGFYCGICNLRGHSTTLCPKYLLQQVGERSVVETTVTMPEEPPSRPILWVVDHPQAIRAILAVYDRQPQGKDKNKKIVEDVATSHGRRAIFTKYEVPK
jgi:hypothetical protein